MKNSCSYIASKWGTKNYVGVKNEHLCLKLNGFISHLIYSIQKYKIIGK